VFVFAVVSDENVHLLGGWLEHMELVAHSIKLVDATTKGEVPTAVSPTLEVERIVAPQKCAVRFAHEYFMDWVSRGFPSEFHGDFTGKLYFPLTLSQYPACVFNRYPHKIIGPGLVRNVHIAPLFRKDPLTSRALKDYKDKTVNGAWNLAIFGRRTVREQRLIVSTDSSRIVLANPDRSHTSHPMSISDSNFHTTRSTFTQLGLAPSLVIVDLSVETSTNPRNKVGSLAPNTFPATPPHSTSTATSK